MCFVSIVCVCMCHTAQCVWCVCVQCVYMFNMLNAALGQRMFFVDALPWIMLSNTGFDKIWLMIEYYLLLWQPDGRTWTDQPYLSSNLIRSVHVLCSLSVIDGMWTDEQEPLPQSSAASSSTLNVQSFSECWMLHGMRSFVIFRCVCCGGGGTARRR